MTVTAGTGAAEVLSGAGEVDAVVGSVRRLVLVLVLVVGAGVVAGVVMVVTAGLVLTPVGEGEGGWKP